MTQLTQAAMDGNDSAIRMLLNNGAYINEPNSTNGWTPLYWAIYYQKPETVQLLLNNGALVNITDANGDSPLMIAASGGVSSIINALLDKGADVNVRNKQQETALILAANAGNAKLVKMLICKGTVFELSDADVITNAENNKHMNIVQLLYKVKFAKLRSRPTDISQICSQSGVQDEIIKIVSLPPELSKYSINYHNIRPLLHYSGSKSLAIVVQDHRPYILSGYNIPEHVGQYTDQENFRFGPAYITTLTGRPFHEEVSYFINETFKWSGFKSVSVLVKPQATSIEVTKKILSANVDRVVVIKITEWMSEVGGKVLRFQIPKQELCYKIILTILDEKGQEIARSEVRGEDDIRIRSPFVKLFQHIQKVQESTEKIFEKLLNSSEVRLALQ